MKVIPEMHRAH